MVVRKFKYLKSFFGVNVKKLLLTVLIFIVTVSFANQTEPTVVNVSFKNKDYYPYCVGDGKNILSLNPGIAIEAMLSIEKKLNIKFNFERDPWSRQKRKMQYNQIDMIFLASFKESRKQWGVYPIRQNGAVDESKKIIESAYVIYKLKESKLDWDGVKFLNLSGQITTQKGYSIVSFLKERNVDVVENRSNTDLEKLLAKRVEGVARHDTTFDHYFKLNPHIAKKIVKLTIPLKSKAYYLVSSHKFYDSNSILVNQIWDELKNMDTSDKFKTIRNKY